MNHEDTKDAKKHKEEIRNSLVPLSLFASFAPSRFK